MNTVWVLGSSNIDHTYRVDNLPKPGMTIQASEHEIATGGKGANQAIAAAHFGANVCFVGAVGNDEEGSHLIETLKSNNVDVTAVARHKGIRSGNATIFVSNKGENIIVVYGGANMHVSVGSVGSSIGSDDIFVSQLEINLDAVEELLILAARKGAYTILNPSPVKNLSKKTYSHVDLLVANEVEANLLGEIEVCDPLSAKRCSEAIISKYNISAAIVTLGAQGSILTTREQTIHFPSYKVDVIDTQGAGDAFVGSLAATLSRTTDLVQSVSFANRVAALSVTKDGSTQKSLPSVEELTALGAIEHSDL